jgi:pimeloyl-ACP methyl ester carboxylesterase
LLSVAVATLAFFRDRRDARARIADRSTVIESPFGDIEYSQGGEGPAVLVIHGSGGGFDQAELMVEALLGNEFHWIAPSRFGYLRSTFLPGATFDEQAHAYASLLDRLGISRVAVVTLSHGGPSGLLFAALHPDRVSSLTLVSSGVATSAAANQAEANERGATLTTIFEHDWLYWGVTRLFRGRLLNLMGVSDSVAAGLSPDQRRLADRVIDFMNPVSLRSAGATFDNQAALPNGRIAAIRAPTLVLHARDDGLQLFHNAEFAAKHIPGARLVPFDRGGHLLLIVERARLRALTREHIRDHAGAQWP